YAVGAIAHDRNVRQLFDRQRKCFTAAENRITGQQNYRPRELHVALRLDMPGLQRSIFIFPRTEFCLSMKSDAFAVAKPVDDRDRGTVVAPRAVANIDDESFELAKVP